MKLKFLKPNWLNAILTIAILALPIMKERVLLLDGSIVVERMAPFSMIFAYIKLSEYYALILMIGFSLFVYLMVTTIVLLSKLINKYYGTISVKL